MASCTSAKTDPFGATIFGQGISTTGHEPMYGVLFSLSICLARRILTLTSLGKLGTRVSVFATLRDLMLIDARRKLRNSVFEG